MWFQRCVLSRPTKKKAIYIRRQTVRCSDARDLALNQHKQQKPPWTIKFLSSHCIKLPKVRSCKSIFCGSGLLQANSETLGQKAKFLAHEAGAYSCMTKYGYRVPNFASKSSLKSFANKEASLQIGKSSTIIICKAVLYSSYFILIILSSSIDYIVK